MSPRTALLACLLSLASPSFAQNALPPPSGQWQADEKQNEKLFKQAEADFKAQMKAHRAQMGDGSGADGGTRHGGMGGGGFGGGGMHSGGMGGGFGGGMHGGGMHGGRHGGAGGEHGERGLAGLLPSELAFAAPEDGTLIVQRMHDAVAFAPDASGTSVTMIPLSADGTDLGNGVKVVARDDAGNLVLDATTPNGLKVQYRYEVPADKTGTLAVHIAINGRMVDDLKIERVYQRGDAK